MNILAANILAIHAKAAAEIGNKKVKKEYPKTLYMRRIWRVGSMFDIRVWDKKFNNNKQEQAYRDKLEIQYKGTNNTIEFSETELSSKIHD